MAHLSSCYFCGTALDEPLQTYELPGSDRTTVSLCPSCTKKLDVVLDSAGLSDLRVVGAGSTEDETEAGDKESSTPAETTAHDDEREHESEDETDPFEDEMVSLDVEEKASEAGDEKPAFDERDDSPGDENLLPEDDPLAAGTDETGDETEVASSREDDETGRTGTSEASRDVKNQRDAGEKPKDGETNEGSADDGTQTRQTISALEYNRVMRMLQNREFPVDRPEIEFVAANAYDLAESECAQVIDLAVDRGLLVERDGQLYRPGD